ncbi:hypothetical protein PT2222_140006 [Paraburkholderia tropica]
MHDTWKNHYSETKSHMFAFII